FNAFDGKCPHAGADLGEGLRCGNRVICPWHHGTFDSTDGSLIEPVAMKGLTRYSVTRQGDNLIVDTTSNINERADNDRRRRRCRLYDRQSATSHWLWRQNHPNQCRQ
ncbi:MAG: Rieske 2Fe-2S domain-containing protein, partial [Psychrobacter sp.]